MIVLFSLLAIMAASSEAYSEPARAGVARMDITPPMELKASLGGYGARMNEPAIGVHDRIYAKALFLSDGVKQFALVSADVLAFPPGVKSAVVEYLVDSGWKNEEIMLLPSHSHTSIDMSALNPKNNLGIPQIGFFHEELFQLTVERLAKVIIEASKSPAPVSVGTSTIQLSGWNRNRRKDNTICETDLTITRIDRLAGDPLAVLVNWTAHPTLMGSRDMMFSGGRPGHLQRTLEALIDRGVKAMYHNGAQADQSPVSRENSGGSWERAERYGRELGIIAWEEWQKVKPVPLTDFAYNLAEINLPKRVAHPDFMQTGGTEYGMNEELVEHITNRLIPSKTHSISLRLGDVIITGVPGEIAAQLGISIKSAVREETGVKNVAIGGLADEWVSYILSAEEYRKGGYEASVSFYGEKLGQCIVEGSIRSASKQKE